MVGLFNPFLLVHSVSNFFLYRFLWSGTVTKRSLHVKSLSTSFGSIKIPTKLYGSPHALFSYGPAWSCLIYLFENA